MHWELPEKRVNEKTTLNDLNALSLYFCIWDKPVRVVNGSWDIFRVFALQDGPLEILSSWCRWSVWWQRWCTPSHRPPSATGSGVRRFLRTSRRRERTPVLSCSLPADLRGQGIYIYFLHQSTTVRLTVSISTFHVIHNFPKCLFSGLKSSMKSHKH